MNLYFICRTFLNNNARIFFTFEGLIRFNDSPSKIYIATCITRAFKFHCLCSNNSRAKVDSATLKSTFDRSENLKRHGRIAGYAKFQLRAISNGTLNALITDHEGRENRERERERETFFIDP